MYVDVRRRVDLKSSVAFTAAALMLAAAPACGSSPAPEGRDAVNGLDAGVVDGFRYSCGRGSPFTAEDLEGSGNVEEQDSELGAALRELLEMREGRTLPRSGWHALAENDEEVLLGAASAGGGHLYGSALFERTEKGWDAAGWGDCTPIVVVGRRSPAIWKLAEEPSPESTTLSVSLEERDCSGGRKLTADNTRVDVEYSAETIAILVTGDPLEAGATYTCPLLINHMTIPLEEPVGDRTLLDVAVYPPARRRSG
jgi:hypothetical protein